MSSAGTIFHPARAIGVFLMALAVSVFAENSYKDRNSGDEAFAAEDYATASSFYGQYRHKAARLKDRDALRDAFERQIDALILAGVADLAAKVLAEYEMEYPGANPLSLSMWKADIQLLGDKPAEARRIIERILPGLTTDDPRRVRAMISLAKSMEMLNDYEAAAGVFRKIMDSSGKTPLGLRAFLRRVLCLANTQTPKKALEELFSYPENLSPRDRVLIRLLTVYAAIKTYGFHDISPAWKEISGELEQPPVPDAIAFSILSSIGDSAAKAGRLEMSIDAYRGAFNAAPDKNAAFATVRRLVDVFNRAGAPVRAAELALSSIKLFKGAYAEPELKLKTALILRNAGMAAESVSIYENILNDTLIPRTLRLDAARQCAYLLNDMKKPEAAGKIVDANFNTPELRGEGSFLNADFLLRSGNPEAAAAAFEKTADRYPDWRARALYQAALSMLEAKNTAKALPLIRKLAADRSDPDSAANALFLTGMAAEQAGKNNEAVNAYRSYQKSSRADAELAAKALFCSGRLALAAGDNDSAEQDFQKILTLYPKEPDAPLAARWKIYSAYSRGDIVQAERETWLLAEHYPESEHAVSALFALARHYAESGAMNRATSVLDNLESRVKSEELKAKILFEMADVSFRSGKTARTTELLQRLYSNYPDSKVIPDARYLNADMLRAAGDYRQALELYRQVLAGTPSLYLEAAAQGALADLYQTLGGIAQDAELYRKSLTFYTRILGKSGMPPMLRTAALYKAGKVSELLSRDDEALKYYNEALQYLEPGCGASLEYWGVKAAESIAGIAEKRPLRMHVDAAVRAIRKLSSNDLLDRDTAENRVLKLQKLKFTLKKRSN